MPGLMQICGFLCMTNHHSWISRQALTLGLLWKSLKDYDLWPMYLVGLLFGIAGYPVSQYFQISMSRSERQLSGNITLQLSNPHPR